MQQQSTQRQAASTNAAATFFRPNKPGNLSLVYNNDDIPPAVLNTHPASAPLHPNYSNNYSNYNTSIMALKQQANVMVNANTNVYGQQNSNLVHYGDEQIQQQPSYTPALTSAHLVNNTSNPKQAQYFSFDFTPDLNNNFLSQNTTVLNSNSTSNSSNTGTTGTGRFTANYQNMPFSAQPYFNHHSSHHNHNGHLHNNGLMSSQNQNVQLYMHNGDNVGLNHHSISVPSSPLHQQPIGNTMFKMGLNEPNNVLGIDSNKLIPSQSSEMVRLLIIINI
jgi:hypothetical protein